MTMAMTLGFILGGSFAVCVFAVIAIIKDGRWD